MRGTQIQTFDKVHSKLFRNIEGADNKLQLPSFQPVIKILPTRTQQELKWTIKVSIILFQLRTHLYHSCSSGGARAGGRGSESYIEKTKTEFYLSGTEEMKSKTFTTSKEAKKAWESPTIRSCKVCPYYSIANHRLFEIFLASDTKRKSRLSNRTKLLSESRATRKNT